MDTLILRLVHAKVQMEVRNSPRTSPPRPAWQDNPQVALGIPILCLYD